jgi:2-polyprenyl-6-methoxyphenol hydroxylase-like FAD-dependent oxidoreductase
LTQRSASTYIDDVKEHTAGVVIVGGGPTGLLLAIELRLAGLAPVVLERLPEISPIPKGNGLFGLIVPALDFRGLLEPLRAGATFAGPAPGFQFGALQLNFGLLDHSPLDILAIPQRTLELRLAERLAELGGTVTRGHEVTGLVQDAGGVTLGVTGPDGRDQVRARYVVGCDGAHSGVRKQSGIGFPGVTSTEISRIGRVRLPPELINPVTRAVELPGFGTMPPMQHVRTAAGSYTIGPLASLDASAPADAYIVSTREEDPEAGPAGADGAGPAGGMAEPGPMTLDELKASMRRVLGTGLPMSDPLWLSRIAGNSRQADRYQEGRVLLAGDAAHVFGLGGSLNCGLMDAMNLGWKLAAELSGQAPAGLLGSYHAERHAAGRRMLVQGRAQRALLASGEAAEALREIAGGLLAYPDVVRHLGQLIQGSDLRYDRPDGADHPLAGRLAPDLPLIAGENRTRVAELLRTARPVLLDLTPDGRVAAAAAGRAGHVPELVAQPAAGSPPADALLIRPDGYVAWASGPGAADPAAGLGAAISTWFGLSGGRPA